MTFRDPDDIQLELHALDRSLFTWNEHRRPGDG
jgi:hypothetical protein